MKAATIEKIKEAVEHAREKHPTYAVISEQGVSIIAEEFGEMAQAVNDNDKSKAKEEAFHVIATCIRFVEEL